MNVFFEQLKDQLSHPVAIFFCIAYILSLFMYHIKARRKLLATKFISDSNYATYYFLMGATPGALGALIAGSGGLLQALTPDKYMAKTKFYRLGFAIFLSLVSIHFSTAKTNDMLPLFGVIFGRLAEMAKTTQRIRVGMALTFPLWMVYNVNHHFYLLLFANISSLASLTWAVFKHHRIKLVPEPV